MALPATRPTAAFPSGAALSADQLLEIYYFLRLTRTLEDRLVALYRQTKVIGGLFRSLGQEGESVASAYATPPQKQFAVKDLAEKAKGYGVPSVTVDGNDVFAVYEATRFAVERARRGKGVHFIEVKTYRRKGHAEHDDQHYVPKADLEKWGSENDPVDRYTQRLLSADMVAEGDLKDIDDRVRVEVDQATDACVDEPLPPAESALPGVYVDPAAADKLWFKLL